MLSQQNTVITFYQSPMVLTGSISFLEPAEVLKDVLRCTNQISGIFLTLKNQFPGIFSTLSNHTPPPPDFLYPLNCR